MSRSKRERGSRELRTLIRGTPVTLNINKKKGRKRRDHRKNKNAAPLPTRDVRQKRDTLRHKRNQGGQTTRRVNRKGVGGRRTSRKAEKNLCEGKCVSSFHSHKPNRIKQGIEPWDTQQLKTRQSVQQKGGMVAATVTVAWCQQTPVAKETAPPKEKKCKGRMVYGWVGVGRAGWWRQVKWSKRVGGSTI